MENENIDQYIQRIKYVFVAIKASRDTLKE